MPNKLRKCTGCKQRFLAETMIKLPAGNFHSMDCAIEYVNTKTERERQRAASRQRKVERESKKAQRREHKEARERLKRKSEWMREAQAAFNRYVRLKDKGKPCISCGKPEFMVQQEQQWKTGGAWDCGHYLSRGARPQLRFNLHNAHRQCKSCNAGSGKFSHKAETVQQRYRERLIKKIGLEKVEALEQNQESRPFDIQYLKRIKVVFNRKYRMLKRQTEIGR